MCKCQTKAQDTEGFGKKIYCFPLTPVTVISSTISLTFPNVQVPYPAATIFHIKFNMKRKSYNIIAPVTKGDNWQKSWVNLDTSGNIQP